MSTRSTQHLARKILDYLSSRPDARDTLEGIAEWWSLEQRIQSEITAVKEALGELVARGSILECSGRDGRIHYATRRQPSRNPGPCGGSRSRRIKEP